MLFHSSDFLWKCAEFLSTETEQLKWWCLLKARDTKVAVLT